MSERTLDGLAAGRARGRTGGHKPKLTTRQAKIAREMYEETGPDGRRLHTVEQIAAEFGVTRPTIYRHLAKLSGESLLPLAVSAQFTHRDAEPLRQPAHHGVRAMATSSGTYPSHGSVHSWTATPSTLRPVRH